MSVRKEVFQAKVLRKLYPAPAQLKLEKVVYPPSTTEVNSIANKDGVIATSNTPVTGNGDGEIPTLAGRRLYTVLPPPEGYRGDAELPVVSPAPESPSKGSELSEEADDIQEEQPRRKRRRRKKKASEVPADRSEGTEGVAGSEVNGAQTTSTTERLSRNKKRKLKKKRHKEKLRSLGLAPQASAVEFTYQHAEGAEAEEDSAEDAEEEEEFNDEHAAEVLEFLETTLQTYISDRSSPERTAPSGAVALLSSLSDRTAPPGELARLRGLKELVVRRRVDELSRALEEFRSSTSISPEEASAVCTLFHYWITDIFPLGVEVLKT
ncbi:glutamate-rich protein 1 [Sardina pilchardus]|uniref:glutamate-rich protein 1 n=1 Tax=Sardina pilchardus TaxID=27697 RepID=UPI002E15691B